MRRLIKRHVKSLIWYRNKRRIVKMVAIEFRIGGGGGTKRNNFKHVVQYKVKRYQKTAFTHAAGRTATCVTWLKGNTGKFSRSISLSGPPFGHCLQVFSSWMSIFFKLSYIQHKTDYLRQNTDQCEHFKLGFPRFAQETHNCVTYK